MKTLAQVIFDTAKPNSTFEEHRQLLIDSGAFSIDVLDSPVESEVEDKHKKTITPRSVNWKGHEVIRRSLRKNTQISDIVRFLINVIHQRMQKTGNALNVELVEEWISKVDPYLDELSAKDAVEVSLEWLRKAITLGEFSSKTMRAYLNTKNKSSNSENVGGIQKEDSNDSYFPEDDGV